MYACTECGSKAGQLFLKNSSIQQVSRCSLCSRKMDRYFEVNDLVKLIDLLLLKRRIFRHYLFNNKRNFTPGIIFMLIVRILAKPILQHHKIIEPVLREKTLSSLAFAEVMTVICKDMLGSSIETVLLLTLVFIAFRRYAGFARLSGALILSNFYCMFVFIMIVWRYDWEEYLPVIDFLCTACNSIVISELCPIRNEVAVGYMYGSRFVVRLMCQKAFQLIGL